MEAEASALGDVPSAQVGGHDENRVLEVDHTAVVVREMPLIQHLQKDVEDVRVGLLDLVQKHDGVGPAAHRLRERTGVLVAHVSRRRSNKSRDGELLHVLAHVHPNQSVAIGEQEFREGPGQLGLADSGGAREDERPDGAVRILQPRTAAPDGPRDGRDGIVLAHHTLVDLLLHVDETLRFGLLQPGDRNARPAADDEGHVLGPDLGAVTLALFFPVVLLAPDPLL